MYTPCSGVTHGSKLIPFVLQESRDPLGFVGSVSVRSTENDRGCHKVSQPRKRNFIMNIKQPTNLILTALWLLSSPRGSTALTNNTCPTPGDGVQSGIVPWTAVGTTIETFGFLLRMLKYGGAAIDPLSIGLFMAAGAVWDLVGNHFQSQNTYKELYNAAYALVRYDQELDQDQTEHSLNWILANLATSTQEYNDFLQLGEYGSGDWGGPGSSPACKALDSAISYAESAYTYVNTYSPDDINKTAQVFEGHLTSIATLHLASYRERYYNGTMVCGDDHRLNQYYLNQTYYYYGEYMDWYNTWTPMWANWRTQQVVTGDGSDREFIMQDKVTGMVCKGWLSRDNRHVADDFMFGTITAIQNDAVAYMLAMVNPMNGLSRWIPGHESDPFEYPSESAPWPLNLYQTGIPLGPYRQWGGQLFGYRIAESEEKTYDCTDMPKTKGLPTSFSFAHDFSTYHPGIMNTKVQYTHGEGTQCGMSDSYAETFEVPSINSTYIQSMSFYTGVNTQMAQNCDDDTIATKHDGIPAYKCQCNSVFSGARLGFNNSAGVYSETTIANGGAVGNAWVNGQKRSPLEFNMTITYDFAMVSYGNAYLPKSYGKYDTNTNGNRGNDVCQDTQTVARSFWAPVELLSEFDTTTSSARRMLRGRD